MREGKKEKGRERGKEDKHEKRRRTKEKKKRKSEEMKRSKQECQENSEKSEKVIYDVFFFLLVCFPEERVTTFAQLCKENIYEAPG